jgi:hypothetical protein
MKKTFFKQLNKVFNELILAYPNEIKCIFIHGSILEGKESQGSYREEMYYFKNRFLFSNFTFQDQPPDIDIIIVTNLAATILNRLKTIIHRMPHDYFITINFISPKEYMRLLKLKQSTAPKVILLFKKIDILYGIEYVKKLQKMALLYKDNKDKLYHCQFMAKKRLIHKYKNEGRKSFIINRVQYQQYFPLLLDGLEGKTIGGFSINRTKYVYPYSMRLKQKINIDSGKFTFLE